MSQHFAKRDIDSLVGFTAKKLFIYIFHLWYIWNVRMTGNVSLQLAPAYLDKVSEWQALLSVWCRCLQNGRQCIIWKFRLCQEVQSVLIHVNPTFPRNDNRLSFRGWIQAKMTIFNIVHVYEFYTSRAIRLHRIADETMSPLRYVYL